MRRKPMLIQTTDKAEFYKAPSGAMFAFTEPFKWRDFYYSPDGQNFFEIKSRGFGGSGKEFTISYENPHNSTSGKIRGEDNRLFTETEVFDLVDSFPEIEVTPLPTIRITEYLFMAAGGQYFYVCADKYNYSYESFRLFVGTPPNLRPIKIKHVERYRDGGTTYIRTDEGILFSPSPFKEGVKATWTNVDKFEIDLVKLDPSQFKITETEDGVTIEPIS